MASTRPSVTPPDSTAARGPRAPFHRLALAGAIAVVLVASWSWLAWQDWAMRHMDVVDMAMPSAQPWSARDVALVFAMWAIMMVAMMLPSALPMLRANRRVDAARGGERGVELRAAMLALGYVAAWIAFSAAATLGQWALHAAGRITPSMALASARAGGAVLILAGLYQWTPLKDACLRTCRSPLGFLLNRWRPGMYGAFRMGVEHGAYCTGCCWLLMAILFVVGVMDIVWIAVLALYVLVEKLTPRNRWLPRAAGAALVAWGAWALVAG